MQEFLYECSLQCAFNVNRHSVRMWYKNVRKLKKKIQIDLRYFSVPGI